MTLNEMLADYFRMRPCFVCASDAGCRHRQIDLALAELETLDRERPARRPASRETHRHAAQRKVAI